jgi:hypothetical protein
MEGCKMSESTIENANLHYNTAIAYQTVGVVICMVMTDLAFLPLLHVFISGFQQYMIVAHKRVKYYEPLFFVSSLTWLVVILYTFIMIFND